MKKILVTGSAGFIGFHVSTRLLMNGYPIIGIDNLNDYYDINLKKARLAHLAKNPHFQFIKMDIVERQQMSSLFEKEKPEYVFLAAAMVGGIMANNTFRADFIYQNIMIQSNVINASWKYGVKKLLFLG